jgi:hypothetical protein
VRSLVGAANLISDCGIAAALGCGVMGEYQTMEKSTKDNAMSGESFFPGFRASMIQTRGPKIWTLKGGDGPPLLLLLGHPETHIAGGRLRSISEEAMREYLRYYQLPNAIHAVCEDYRAAAGIDLEQDAQDDRVGKRI